MDLGQMGLLYAVKLVLWVALVLSLKVVLSGFLQIFSQKNLPPQDIRNLFWAVFFFFLAAIFLSSMPTTQELIDQAKNQPQERTG